MPPNRKNSAPPPVMTWGKALPVLVVAGIFDLVRIFFEWFWFFGPALGAVYCTTKVNDVVGTGLAETAGKLIAGGCGVVAGAVGYFGSPAIIAFGVVMAIAVGLFGWMTAGLMLIMTNARIFKENEGHALWFGFSLLISEVPIIGSLPALTGVIVKMYSTQIKKDKENLKKYEKETAAARLQEQNQQTAYLMQAQAAQQMQTEQQEAQEIAEEEEVVESADEEMREEEEIPEEEEISEEVVPAPMIPEYGYPKTPPPLPELARAVPPTIPREYSGAMPPPIPTTPPPIPIGEYRGAMPPPIPTTPPPIPIGEYRGAMPPPIPVTPPPLPVQSQPVPPPIPEWARAIPPTIPREYSGAMPPPIPATPPPIPIKASGMEERTIENPELLSGKAASKKFLAEERSKLAQEIFAQRKQQHNRLTVLKNTIETTAKHDEGIDDKQFDQFVKYQSAEANELAKRISSSELSAQDVQSERENISQLVANSENLKSIKEKLEEHYAKADAAGRERFDILNRSLEHVMQRNNAFLVHMISESEETRHNANSNVSSETTYEDDIDIMLAFEPSISTSSIISGKQSGLWSGGSGFLLGGGQVGEAGHCDLGSHSDLIKKRTSAGGEDATIEKIDEVVGRRGGENTGMNEIVVNNAAVFGYFQKAEKDEDGRFWMFSLKTKERSEEVSNRGRYKERSAKILQENISRYKEHFDVASERGVPLYVMTPDRNVHEYLGVNDDGSVNIGKQLTPEEVATGRAGLSAEKRKEIGEKLLEKKIFKKQETQEEAREIIKSLSKEIPEEVREEE